MIRGIDLRGAVSINVITMIGIGPLLTIPLVLANLHGSTALWAWIVGAILACCDGLVYAELGSLYPSSGGTYVFLREAFGRERWGRCLAFLFAWQFVLSAPLLVATGYIGFAQYAGFFWAPLARDAHLQGIVAAGLGIVTLVALYRPVRAVAAFGVVLAGVAVATLGALAIAGLTHGSAARAFGGDTVTPLATALIGGLGPSLVLTLYDYAGYAQATTIGDEIREPARTLPRSIVISVLAVAALYVAMQLGVLAVIPWRELVATVPGGPAPAIAGYVASSVVERVWGTWPARIVTVAVLATAFASTYGNLLGMSRVPYAAARDGLFFRPFARLHPRDAFPHVSLLVLGLIALPACFLPFGDVVSALTAGLVIVQSIAQIVALVALRARGTSVARAPYRMWLYPLPAIVALVGWIAIFIASGTPAIIFGLVSLAVGIAAYLLRARRATDWPFARAATLAIAIVCAGGAACVPAAARAATWGHAATVERPDGPVFEVDGKPFFLYGAAFFYERIPRDLWRASMLQLKEAGINTLDLYVPWNWHELSDGDFDFDGRTNPRRDLVTVLALARELDFEIVLRPGPVVRNEWRNGGYPAWLLERPEYGMPEHDRLEGRYPPTATLQNANSDDAAAAWMRNATHLTYARRWLERVLHVCEPDAGRIVAIALDDDQGAYIDNQTWPAPHFRAYVAWLRDVVHGVTGASEPVFVNTYQMKVTASSPVWAMGNWYQSDAYAIGEHDRAQLDFSTALLHTRPGQPMMASEFQAGWLLQAADVFPRSADPSNTALALATMFGDGVRGVVNFPARDTLYPSGWEVPFANAFYAWDAAFAFDGRPTQRYVPTAAFGALVSAFGPELAASHVRYDAAIAYLGGSVRVDRATNDFFAGVEGQTILAQRACRDAGLSCALVDPAAIATTQLARYPLVIVPLPAGTGTNDETQAVRTQFAAYRARGGRIVPLLDGSALARAFEAGGRLPVVTGTTDASFAPDPSGRLDGFFSIVNYAATPRTVTGASIALSLGRRTLPPFVVPAHGALVVPVGVRLASLATGFASDDRLEFTDCMPLGISIAGGAIAYRLSTDDPRTGATLRSETQRCTARVRFAGKTRDVRLDAGAIVAATMSRTGDTTRDMPRSARPVVPPISNVSQTVPIRSDVALGGVTFRPVTAGTSIAYAADVYRDGTQSIVLDNGLVRVVVSPDAGARAFVFEDLADGRSAFTTVGAMRDDVAIEPPLSTVDRIAKYTHDFPAGTFNRPYEANLDATSPVARATFRYAAPDVVPAGADFQRTITLAPGARAFDLDERVTFGGSGDAARMQRAVSVSSLAAGADDSTQLVLGPEPEPFATGTTFRVTTGHAFGTYDANTRKLATIAWRAGDVDDAALVERRDSIVSRLTFARGRIAHVRFEYGTCPDIAAARAALAAADRAAQGR